MDSNSERNRHRKHQGRFASVFEKGFHSFQFKYENRKIIIFFSLKSFNQLSNKFKNLSNSDYRIRSKCLKILSFHYVQEEAMLKSKIVKILLNYMDDQDPRVRITSLELLVSY